MNTKFRIVAAAWVAGLLAACSPSPQSLIVGTWQAESAAKITAEFDKDGTAKITMFGQTLRGTYKLTSDHELEWSLNGTTTRATIKVTATELELTDASKRSIVYKRK